MLSPTSVGVRLTVQLVTLLLLSPSPLISHQTRGYLIYLSYMNCATLREYNIMSQLAHALARPPLPLHLVRPPMNDAAVGRRGLQEAAGGEAGVVPPAMAAESTSGYQEGYQGEEAHAGSLASCFVLHEHAKVHVAMFHYLCVLGGAEDQSEAAGDTAAVSSPCLSRPSSPLLSRTSVCGSVRCRRHLLPPRHPREVL